MNSLCEFIVYILREYGLYIMLAIMLGVNKSVERVEADDLDFTIKNILKYSIIYSIIAPLKLGLDIKVQTTKRKIKE